MLDINPLSTSFANIFSHAVGFLFIDGILCCAKAFKFNQLPYIFAFIPFRRQIQKNITEIYVKECSTFVCFPLGVF